MMLMKGMKLLCAVGESREDAMTHCACGGKGVAPRYGFGRDVLFRRCVLSFNLSPSLSVVFEYHRINVNGQSLSMTDSKLGMFLLLHHRRNPVRLSSRGAWKKSIHAPCCARNRRKRSMSCSAILCGITCFESNMLGRFRLSQHLPWLGSRTLLGDPPSVVHTIS